MSTEKAVLSNSNSNSNSNELTLVPKPRMMKIFGDVINEGVYKELNVYRSSVNESELAQDLVNEYKNYRVDFNKITRDLQDKSKGLKTSVKNKMIKEKNKLNNVLNSDKYEKVREFELIKSKKVKNGKNVNAALSSVVHVLVERLVEFAADRTLENKKRNVQVNYMYTNVCEEDVKEIPLFKDLPVYCLIKYLPTLSNYEKYFTGKSHNIEDDKAFEDKYLQNSVGKICDALKKKEEYSELCFGQKIKLYLSSLCIDFVRRLASMSQSIHDLSADKVKTIQDGIVFKVLELILNYNNVDDETIMERAKYLFENVYKSIKK